MCSALMALLQDTLPVEHAVHMTLAPAVVLAFGGWASMVRDPTQQDNESF